MSKKSRTREAILTGARALIARGLVKKSGHRCGGGCLIRAFRARPPIAISRTPRYLPPRPGLAVEVSPYEDVVEGAETPRARTLAVSRYIFDLSIRHEAAFRQFLARNLDAWATSNDRRTPRGAARCNVQCRS